MQNSRGRSSLVAVSIGAGLLLIWSVVFVAITGTSARATDNTGQGSGQSTASHSNGHGNDDAQLAASEPSSGNAGTSGDSTQPQPISSADANSGGANGQCPDGPYCSTRDGSASGNGNGGGMASGKPCAGCVGKADNKNPQGQMPDASDGNNGYECDGNHGIARGNPAHTTCTPAPSVGPTQQTKPPECVESVPQSCVLGEHFQRPVPSTQVQPTAASRLPLTGLPVTWGLTIGLVALITGVGLTAMSAGRRGGAHALGVLPAFGFPGTGKHTHTS